MTETSCRREFNHISTLDFIAPSRGEAVRVERSHDNDHVKTPTEPTPSSTTAELKRIEERWCSALQGFGDGVWDWDLLAGTTFFSHRWQEMLGYTPGEIGNSISEWQTRIHVDDAQAVLDDINRHLRGETETFASEYRMRCKSGTYVWIQGRGRVVARDVDDKPLRMVGANRDQTERRQLIEQLVQQNAKLSRSNLELEQFAYVASHDLQEPLRAVAGCAQILAEAYSGQLDQDADALIVHLVQGAERMQTLIRDLLTLSRVGAIGRAVGLIDCEGVVQAALRNLKDAIHDNNVSFQIDRLPEVYAEPTQLCQVWQNLIGNAIKYRGDATPRIEIFVRCIRGEWRFAVRDNGIGIESRYHQRIFGLFQRLHTRDAYPGTGIGLALCKKIVEGHGGRIWVLSRPTVGTTVYFTLPVRPAKGDE